MPYSNNILVKGGIKIIVMFISCLIVICIISAHHSSANTKSCNSEDWTECANENQKLQWIEYAKDWKFIKKKGDITLYKRVLPSSGIIQVKAEKIIQAKAEVLEQIIRDIPAYPELMHNCLEGRLIKAYTDEDMIILNVTGMPWPLQPRDVVVKTNVIKNWDVGRFEIVLKGLHSPDSEQWVPFIKGHTRMYELTAFFIAHLLDREKTKCIYIIHADPTGVPGFIINLLIDDYPYYTLLNLEKMTKRQKYVSLGEQSKYLSQIESFIKYKNNKN